MQIESEASSAENSAASDDHPKFIESDSAVETARLFLTKVENTFKNSMNSGPLYRDWMNALRGFNDETLTLKEVLRSSHKLFCNHSELYAEFHKFYAATDPDAAQVSV